MKLTIAGLSFTDDYSRQSKICSFIAFASALLGWAFSIDAFPPLDQFIFLLIGLGTFILCIFPTLTFIFISLLNSETFLFNIFFSIPVISAHHNDLKFSPLKAFQRA